jgi:phage I-like protein
MYSDLLPAASDQSMQSLSKLSALANSSSSDNALASKAVQLAMRNSKHDILNRLLGRIRRALNRKRLLPLEREALAAVIGNGGVVELSDWIARVNGTPTVSASET